MLQLVTGGVNGNGGLSAVVDDPAPVLGGNLDGGGYDISNVGTATLGGDLYVSDGLIYTQPNDTDDVITIGKRYAGYYLGRDLDGMVIGEIPTTGDKDRPLGSLSAGWMFDQSYGTLLIEGVTPSIYQHIKRDDVKGLAFEMFHLSAETTLGGRLAQIGTIFTRGSLGSAGIDPYAHYIGIGTGKNSDLSDWYDRPQLAQTQFGTIINPTKLSIKVYSQTSHPSLVVYSGDLYIRNGKLGIGIAAPSALLDINSDILRLRTAKTPASEGAAGNTGDICWDASYVYVCVADSTWKRAAINTW